MSTDSHTIDSAKMVAQTNKGIPIQLSDGTNVDIYKCKVKQLAPMLEFVRFVLEKLQINSVTNLPVIDLDDPNILLSLLVDSSEKVFEVGAMLSSLTEEGFVDLELDDAITVLAKEWEVNKDFFLKSVLPKLDGLRQNTAGAGINNKDN